MANARKSALENNAHLLAGLVLPDDAIRRYFIDHGYPFLDVPPSWKAQDPATVDFEILTFEGSFHGRSTGAIAAAGSEKMVKGFGPLMPGFRSLPWADMAVLVRGRVAVS